MVKACSKKELDQEGGELLAQRMWAIARLNARGELNHSSNLPPAKREKLIQAELERLPDQDWWKIFKKAGCDDLKNAPAGRPAKKTKQT